MIEAPDLEAAPVWAARCSGANHYMKSMRRVAGTDDQRARAAA